MAVRLTVELDSKNIFVVAVIVCRYKPLEHAGKQPISKNTNFLEKPSKLGLIGV
jgi:hypothetical protein